jgi:putative OPT family oligopeptide transporter
MAEESRTYVPAEESLPELTAKALLLGVVVAALLGAANAYLGFKAGQTVSATFPAAVLAIAAFRLPFFRGTVLEQNTMRTAASVGEALAAGAIFTVPAFVMVNVGGERLWTGFNYWETSLILLVGGLLGILFIILLRRTLTVDAQLPFPESRACAQIVVTGQKGDTGARYVFGAMGLGMLIQVFKDPAGIPLFQESVRFLREFPASVVHHMSSKRIPLGDVTHNGALVLATPSISPALIGVGYIIGFELSAINFAGGVLAWLVFVPLALFLNPGLGQQLTGPNGPPALPELVHSIWFNQIRPIAVGAMLVGAMRTLWTMRSSIAQAFRGALHRGSTAEPLRTERDLPARGIVIAIAALTVPVALLYHHFTGSWTGAVVAAVVMMATGFLFSAVGGYLVGLVGSSNQPVSGLALSTLIIAALLMLGFGVRGLSGVGAVLGVAAVVCCACCVAGSLIQDLKVGQILGGTPWKMEVAEIVATVVTAFVLVWPIVVLHEGNIRLGGIGIGDPLLPAPQAGLMAQMAQGIVGGEMPWALILFGMAFAFALVLIKAPSPMLVAVGMYLQPETTGAIFLGGCLKALVDWRARRARLAAEGLGHVESTGSLVAAGLIAGESLTGVLLASFVLASPRFTSVGGWLGLPAMAYLDGPLGAGLALVPLGLITWLLVRIPVRHALAMRGSSRP